MFKILFTLILLFSSITFSEEIYAFYKYQYLTDHYQYGPNGSYCNTVNEATQLVLNGPQTKNLSFTCNYYDGIRITFEGLTLPPTPPPDEEPILSRWKSDGFMIFKNGNDCSILASKIKWLMNYITVRNLTYSVFCNGGMGSIYYSYEVLVPFE